jgi:hypothetical protein
MSDAYVIEIHGKTVGLIVRYPGAEEGYRFLASADAFNGLEGQTFSGPYQAERAARAPRGYAPSNSGQRVAPARRTA